MFVSRNRKHSAERPPEMGGWVPLNGGPAKTDPVSLFCFRLPLGRDKTKLRSRIVSQPLAELPQIQLQDALQALHILLRPKVSLLRIQICLSQTQLAQVVAEHGHLRRCDIGELYRCGVGGESC